MSNELIIFCNYSSLSLKLKLCILYKRIHFKNSYGDPLGYIIKDEWREKFKVDKWGIPGHPNMGSSLEFNVTYYIVRQSETK